MILWVLPWFRLLNPHHRPINLAERARGKYCYFVNIYRTVDTKTSLNKVETKHTKFDKKINLNVSINSGKFGCNLIVDCFYTKSMQYQNFDCFMAQL